METRKYIEEKVIRLGASNLRTELKRAFPDVKFRVTSKSFPGGDSIDIWCTWASWTDGPTDAMVSDITPKYEEGSYVMTERHSTVIGVREAWKRDGGDPEQIQEQWYNDPMSCEFRATWAKTDLRG